VVEERPFQFEWDDRKAGVNARKHCVTFELASTVFFDPNLLTVGDMEHSENEPRWFSIGIAGNGVLLSVAYLWSDADPFAIKMWLISAPGLSSRATSAECRQYEESL
jgi:hypothetical protein